MVFGEPDSDSGHHYEENDPVHKMLAEQSKNMAAQIENMRHVGGFKVVVSTVELKNHLAGRIAHHAERAAELERKERDIREKLSTGTAGLAQMVKGPLSEFRDGLQGLGGSMMGMAAGMGHFGEQQQAQAVAAIQATVQGLMILLAKHKSLAKNFTFIRDHLAPGDYLLSVGECLQLELLDSQPGSHGYALAQGDMLGYAS